MRPYINDKPLRSLSVPKLSGGVNYRDGISQVLDNQLTDCNNVWYKNGILRTRPGVKCAENNPHFKSDCVPQSDSVNRRIYTNKDNFRVINGATYFLTVIQSVDGLDFRYYAEGKETLCNVNIPANELPQDDFTCNIFQHDADIYCFCSGYYEGQETPYYIFKISENEYGVFEAKRIKDEDLYVPIIATNLFPVATGESTPVSGDFFEGYSLLGNRCKFEYSTTDPNGESDGISMYFVLPYDLIQYDENKNVDWAAKGDFTAEIIHSPFFNAEDSLPVGTVTHKVSLGDNFALSQYVEEAEYQRDGLKLIINGKSFYFVSRDNDGATARIPVSDFVRNNMTVTVPCRNKKENYEKVLNMTFSEWFGGGSEGIYDGIHLFMGGNTAEKEKALVCWSDFDKPLYFSENGYAYVGDKAQRVTAFGKQGESLIILKERETYATQYSSIDSVMDAEAVINQSIVDVTASEVTFPMVQVHGFIGCDCPKTVQLCRNRLVWAHSDGKLYTLVSANQWNERSIFEVSAMVERQLKSYSADALKGALSADWEGHYVLSLGDRFYLMDYNSYGYANVTSYSKSEDAQLHIPWWVWDKPKYKLNTYIFADKVDERRVERREEPVAISSMLTVGARLYLWTDIAARIGDLGGFYTPELLTFEGEDDILPSIVVSGTGLTDALKERIFSKKGTEIPAMAQTKLFDFGSPTVQKSIPKAEVSFGNNEGVPITVTTITDRGEAGREIILDFEETDSRSPQFFKNVVIRNSEKLNNRIGYRLESKGNLFVDALSIYYKLLGGCK